MSEKRGMNRDYDYASSSDVLSKKPSRSFSMKSQKTPDLKLRSMLTKAISHYDRANDDNIKVKYIKEMWEIVESAWQLPVIGRDVAYEFSDTLRREKIVAFVINRLQLEGSTPNVQRECARLLEQILTTDNRHYIAKNCLEVVTKYTKLRGDIELIRINIGILESLFKDSESTCTRLIDLGALDTVLHACRHDDLWTARHCAAALANAAIYGGSINHRRMVKKGTPDWLFPLAFRTDDFCRYYACLAVTVLAANPLVEKAVVRSGTLDLVEPFVQSHDPYEFAESNPSHAQGRAASFLQRMIPLLISGRSEAQALASFYFAMEASIKAKQQKTQVFADIAAIIPLKRVIATSRSSIARTLAGRCLKIIGEDVPRKLSPQIHLWDIEDVQSWLTVAGFRGFQSSFRSSTVDGEMLLLLTERELKEDLSMTNNVHRKRFIRDLNRLRAGADYRSVDTSGICDWLRLIDSKFAQYTYRLLQAGVDRDFLPLLTDIHLKDDCGIENGVHRTRILDSVAKLGKDSSLSSSFRDLSECHDVFISYRRNNGSHLASLLKVHLQVRGFRVFLDVESLQEGDFADRTLKSVRSATAGFVLVLTAGALDKCAIDHEGTDWLHKEIVTAIGNRSNIVPVTTETFQWPLPEDLPKDISPICFYNGVKWIHEYQDACIDKIERFLRGQDPPSAKLSRIASSVKNSRDTVSVPQKRPSTHPNKTVRPSGSSDNLVDADRYPRPRQRASPPGQASSSLMGPLPGRGVPGAQSESARSLDQGDGASAEQGSKQMQYKASSNRQGKTPDRANSVKPKTSSPTSPPSSVSTSSSSKNLSSSSKGIKRDIIRLDDVMGGNSERSRESESSTSSKYDSSEESEEEWENERNKRGGADGKSKQEPKPHSEKPTTTVNTARPSHTQSVKKDNGFGKMEKIGGKKLPGMETNSQPVNQTSPERNPKPSTKYKAPPPPSTTSHEDEAAPPNGNGQSKRPNVPEPHPRPTVPARPSAFEHGRSNKQPPLSASAEPGGSRVSHDLPPHTSAKEKSFKPAATESSLPPKPAPVPTSRIQEPPEKQKPTDTKAQNTPPVNLTMTSVNGERKTGSPQENGQKTASQIGAGPYPGSQLTDGQLSESEYSDINSLEGGDQRTNADGNDSGTTASRSSRTTSSTTPSDLDTKATKSDERVEKKTSGNSNNNNSNNVEVNGKANAHVAHPVSESPQNAGQHSASRSPVAEPRPTSRCQMSSQRSTPLSRSSHSVASADLSSYPGPGSPRKPVVGSNISARRDVAPQEEAYGPRRSASERLKITRPPHPAYPMGGSHFHPSGSHPPPYHQPSPQKSTGYSMDHYKAAMAGAINQPYPKMQHYPPGTHPSPKTAPIQVTHGFDTAV